MSTGAPDADMAALAAEEASSAAFLALGNDWRQLARKKRLLESGIKEELSVNANVREKRRCVLPSVNANLCKNLWGIK